MKERRSLIFTFTRPQRSPPLGLYGGRFNLYCIDNHIYFQLVRRNATLKISRHHLISSLIKLFDCHLIPLIESGELKGKSETELNPLFEGMFFFSCIW